MTQDADKRAAREKKARREMLFDIANLEQMIEERPDPEDSALWQRILGMNKYGEDFIRIIDNEEDPEADYDLQSAADSYWLNTQPKGYFIQIFYNSGFYKPDN
ncbi:hypothetical protein GcC1_063009 [Golovinomyces cichoracearum]|uniref:Uncharacterized protein n=1 Tax=Golovinomyces cichoracearum TaxID=62708 RepID=A0A420ISH7_9PEZI|nr:hypothetical protein GcC1_063009 [Golovinomyces cichoracearum]